MTRAEFLVQSLFSITGRGPVVAGQFQSGGFREGDVLLSRSGASFRIARIERGRDPTSPSGEFVGLVLGPGTDIIDVREAIRPGDLLMISTADA